MNLSARKQTILDYILEKMPQEDIERGIDLQDSTMGFTSYDEFVQKQTEIIQESDKDHIQSLELFINLLFTFRYLDKVDMMDDEPIDGFCFNSDGDIVIFNKC